MANTQRSQWMGEYMRRHALHGPGAFRANQRIMRQASTAYDDAHPAERRARNPRSNSGAVRANPSGADWMKLAAVAVGTYVLMPGVKSRVDSFLGSLGRGPAAAPPGGSL